MRSQLPKIKPLKYSELYKLLQEMVQHYTPEWKGSDEKDPGVALLKIYSQINESVINRFNRAPEKNFVAFLDMLGIRLLPAQSVRAPLTFKLARGTETEVLIPERTQAAADKTTEHEELPFETEKNLQATPSQLKAVLSIDPSKDAIYIPPPGFLDREQQKQNQVTYKIVSSLSAGSKNFQLDHATDLKIGDFLSIGDKEYVVISKISGMIIYITDRLLHAYPADTTVEKITNFNLFEAKNMQEHSLYLGHKDFFNIKSTAQFSLEVTHRAGTDAGVAPLKASWEYWGEVKGEEGEDWHEFNTVDGTQGLSKDGTVELTKMTEGEIKEKEHTKDVKSRWIRCIIKEPLSTDVPRRLPVLDNIMFKVKSSGEKLLPDQAFNNDMPLDIAKPFTPFGKEPRIFDNFSIASKEVFSKKGAKIDIDVEVEKRGISGGPTAVLWFDDRENQKIKVFTRGTYGRLVEIEINPNENEEPAWPEHGFPPDTTVASGSAPSAVSYSVDSDDENISVFLRGENGHLIERSYSDGQWQWIDHGTPEKDVVVSFDPIAIHKKRLYVFVTGSDGQIYELNRDPRKITEKGTWIKHKKLPFTSIASAPYANYYIIDLTPGPEINVMSAISSSIELRMKVFVKGQNGKLYELDCRAGENTDDKNWIDNDMPDPVKKVEVDSRPFAGISTDGSNLRVYVKGSDNNLWEFSNNRAKKWDKKEYNGLIVHSNPHGCIYISSDNELVIIFIRDINGNLWKWENGWEHFLSPPNSMLVLDPFILNDIEEDPGDISVTYYVFSASNQNSILALLPSASRIPMWNEYKDPSETALTPALSWEYWNNKGWLVLKGIKDETENLLKSEKISFNLPEDIEETEVAGQKSYWIRARIIGGDYGKETFSLIEKTEHDISTQQLVSSKNSIRPPIVNKLLISYELETSQYPQQCWAYNNLDYVNQTDAIRVEDKFFSPFIQLEDIEKTLYLGFERALKGGPINIFFSAKELPFTEEKKPKMEWIYSTDNDWKGLKGYFDYTEGLIKSDILELIGPVDFSARSRFGNYLFWIKGNLAKGEYEEYPVLEGIYPNTAWALQAGTIRDEILGSSDGKENQKFSFLKSPVLEGQEIRVQEVLSEEERQEIVAAPGKDMIKEVKDEKGKVIETWVLWKEVPDFFDSKLNDRHYILDHALGQLEFGDGINGMIPPIYSNNIKAFSYQYGGGKQGNIKTGEIKTLKSAVPGVDSVSNPVAADGGADTATLDEMMEIGPAMISHRDRAVTAEDFEWLAKQASRKVVKVKCLPNTNNRRQKETGWVTLIIVPDSPETKPCPSLELRKTVRQYIEARCANTLSHKKHINIDSPSYVEISISVDVFVTSIDKASLVERDVKKKLDAFFHPLTGGSEEKGWDFGRNVSISDIYALLENIEGLDHVENLKFSYNHVQCLSGAIQNAIRSNGKPGCISNSSKESTNGETVEVKENFLVANGTHTINVQLIKEDGSYGIT